MQKKIKYANQNPKMASGGSRGGRRERSPPMKKKKKKREREREREFALLPPPPPPPPPPMKKKEKESERGGGGCSVLLLSISAFIHSPVKCNKSLYMFTRCFALLVYLITFELLKHSTINQKTSILQTLQCKLPIFNREP